jgi:hypothetical protein
MQGNGAEMLRVACILGTERGVRINAPVHDALLAEAPEAQGLTARTSPKPSSPGIGVRLALTLSV